MIEAEPSWSGKEQPHQQYDIKDFGQIEKCPEPANKDSALMAGRTVVDNAPSMTPASMRQQSGVRKPITSKTPKTNSTEETKTALTWGIAMWAATKVCRICSRR